METGISAKKTSRFPLQKTRGHTQVYTCIWFEIIVKKNVSKLEKVKLSMKGQIATSFREDPV